MLSLWRKKRIKVEGVDPQNVPDIAVIVGTVDAGGAIGALGTCFESDGTRTILARHGHRLAPGSFI